MFPELKTLFMLDPEITHLNHGSYGACPKPIFDSLIKWQRILEFEPVRLLGHDIYEYLENSREQLSQFVGCHKNDVIFSPNPSTALNTVIKSLDLNKGDEILTTDHEYGALDKTWSFICKKTGSEYINHPVLLPLNSNDDFIRQFSKGITSKSTS